MSHTPLTDEQIRTTFFEIQDVGLVLAYGPEITNQLLAYRRFVEAHGHKLRFFGWPDGTTVSCEITEPNVPLDVDYLILLYKRFQQTVRPQMEAQHGDH
jgi:hypothetical protein